MNAPTATTRFIGTPRIAAVLYVGVALTVLGWMGGAVPWWLGIMALFFVGAVRKAGLEVKRYDVWAADWSAMSGAPAASKPAKLSPSRGMLAAQSFGFAFIAWIIWNMTPPGQKAPDGQAVMWFLMMGGFVWSLCRLIAGVWRGAASRRAVATKTKATTKPDDDVVEWALPVAAASPSRSEVISRLPGYAARLLTPGGSQ